jgi:hypothetical protein
MVFFVNTYTSSTLNESEENEGFFPNNLLQHYRHCLFKSGVLFIYHYVVCIT